MTDAMTVQERDASKLAQALETASETAIDWLQTVLARPVDDEKPGLLRAQASAAQTVLNVQLRADALRLRAQRHDKVLETLMNLVHRLEPNVPGASRSTLLES